MSAKDINLIYLADIRLPTEKAHGLQIVQMCEAFALANCEVTLVVPQRHNTAVLRSKDPWEYYGVQPVFDINKLWTMSIIRFLPRPIQGIGFKLQSFFFYISVLIWLTRQASDAVLYSRDIYLHWLLSWFFTNRIRIYESHSVTHTRFGLWVQRRVLRSSTLVIALTKHMASTLEAQGHRPVLVEHDGVRIERFTNMPTREEARAALNIPPDTFVAGYLGHLETLGMDKGVGTLVKAFGWCYRERPGWSGRLLVVGGPKEKVDDLQNMWVQEGLPLDAFHAVGHVGATQVPMYLVACDVCTMPHPWTEFFAYHTSPLKLFEYMAAGRPILATDMPVFREVLTEGETALFVPPSDPKAMAEALLRLADDPDLRGQIGKNNAEVVKFYTWEARARRILSALDSSIQNIAVT